MNVRSGLVIGSSVSPWWGSCYFLFCLSGAISRAQKK